MADSLGDGASKNGTAPPKKKSLFSNSTWSKPQDSEEGIDFFSRAKELYPMRIAEEERRRQKKLEKQNQERKRSTASAERKASSTPEIKRQRVSSDAPGGGDNSSDYSPSNQLLNDMFSSHEKLPQESPPTSPVPRTRSQGSPVAHYGNDLGTKPQGAAKQKSMPKNIISLSDSEDGGRDIKSSKSAIQPINLDDDDGDEYLVPPLVLPLEEEDPLMSDEEFPELVQRAREREKHKELERLSANRSFAEKNYKNKTAALAVDDVFEDSSAPEIDPIVEILVTSYMEDTNPLLVRRKLNQRLKEVRLSWCDKQLLRGAPFPPHLRSSVFLTWNGKRLFDASTCQHLGVKMGQDGKFAADGEGYDDNGRLHFEAWTEDLFIAYQKLARFEQEGGEGQEGSEQVKEPAGKIKFLLKAKDMEPFRLRVKPSTTVEKMSNAFRDAKRIPAEQEISLYFDGDKLDPALKVEDSELDDMDTIEVHIR